MKTNAKEQLINELLEHVDISLEDCEIVKSELMEITINEGDYIIIKTTGMTGGSNNDTIYEVLLTNGDMSGHVCYI